jgi:hypothetical protein
VSEASLSNETALGALGTGIILNTTTTGVPTIYAGTSCPNDTHVVSLNASGVATCDTTAGYETIYDEAAGLTQRKELRFNGTGVTCADSGGQTVCTIPSYTLPDATNAVTGGVRLTGQLGGTATSPTVTGVTGAVVGVSNLSATGTKDATTILYGDNTFKTAPSGGGAPTTAQYWTGAADAGLSAEKDLSGFTGLVLNTAGTPSSKAANTCTNQFARSDNASGVWTCASIATADLPTVPVTKGGTNTTTIAANQVWVGTAADTVSVKTIPSCSNATTSKLLYDNATQTFSCGTDQTSAGGGLAGTLLKVVTSDYTNSTVTPSTILSTAVSNATEYGFQCVLVNQGTATGGIRYNINGPTASNVSFITERYTSTSAQTNLILQAFSASAQTAACTTSCNTTNLVTMIKGGFTTTASGTFALQGSSSTAGQSVTVRRGSYCVVY